MHKLFVTCLSSSREHKDYCFWLCMEYFWPLHTCHSHLSQPVHSVAWREGHFFLCEPHSCSQWMDKPVIVKFTQKTDYLIIVPTKADSWTANRHVPTMNDVKLNSHAHSSSFLSVHVLSDCGTKHNKTLAVSSSAPVLCVYESSYSIVVWAGWFKGSSFMILGLEESGLWLGARVPTEAMW